MTKRALWLAVIASASLAFNGCDDGGDDEGTGGSGGTAGSGGTPMGGAMGGTPVGGGMGGTPMGGEPVGGDPMGGSPMGGSPVGGEPVGGEPVGGEPAMCEAPIAVGEECLVDMNCCERGLDCLPVDEMGNGICLRTCDANAESNDRPDGCAPREECTPFDEENPPEDPEAVWEGFCRRGAECGTTQTGECEAPDLGCIADGKLTFCLPVGTQAEGDPCLQEGTGEANDLCAEGLFCMFGVCQSDCNDGTCGEGQTCLDWTDRLGGVEYAVCHNSCNAITQEGCAEGQFCVAADSDGEGNHIGFCLDIPEEEMAPVADDPENPRQNTTCEGDFVYGDCPGNYLCIATTQDGPQQCLEWCDANNLDVCDGPSACSTGIEIFDFLGATSADDFGICIGECNAYAPEEGACADGSYCGLAFLATEAGQDGTGADTITGACFPIEGNYVQAGEACNFDTDTCAAGTLCVPSNLMDPNSQTVCTPMCNPDPNSTANDVCGEGTSCLGGIFIVESLGICVAQ